MTHKFAYLAQGKLYLQQGDGEATEVVCQFGQQVIDRAVRRSQANEWKRQSSNAQYQLWNWGRDGGDPRQVQVAITAATAGRDDQSVLYAMATPEIGGLFTYDLQDNVERRLVHKQGFRLRDLDRHPSLDLVACSHYEPDGTAQIGLIRGYNIQDVTEGDSIDEAPAWIPGEARQLLFQSAGVARNINGFPVGIGPFAIQRLDLEKGELTNVKEDPKSDFLLPHETRDGSIYFIQRPYESSGFRPAGFGRFMTDIVLLPFRILRTLFHYLNFMSLMYSRRPLTSAGGPKQPEEDMKTVILRGRRIDAARALRQSGRRKDSPALVPASWQLIKKTATGEEKVLAKHVVAFDVDENGQVVYTNGMGIFSIGSNGKSVKIGKARFVEALYLMK